MRDTEVIEQYVRLYLRQLYSYAFRLTSNESEAEDIVQETFIKAWKKLASYDERYDVRTWLYAIVRNTAIDHLRKKRELSFADLSLDESLSSVVENIPDNEVGQEELFEIADRKSKLNDLLSLVPFIYREVIILHAFQDMTFDAIGQMLGVSLNTVKSRYRRGLQRLRDECTKMGISNV